MEATEGTPSPEGPAWERVKLPGGWSIVSVEDVSDDSEDAGGVVRSNPAPSREPSLVAHLHVVDSRSTPPASPARSTIPKTKKERNRLLAAELRSLGKPANGDTWKRAKKLLAEGMNIDDAAREA